MSNIPIGSLWNDLLGAEYRVLLRAGAQYCILRAYTGSIHTCSCHAKYLLQNKKKKWLCLEWLIQYVHVSSLFYSHDQPDVQSDKEGEVPVGHRSRQRTMTFSKGDQCVSVYYSSTCSVWDDSTFCYYSTLTKSEVSQLSRKLAWERLTQSYYNSFHQGGKGVESTNSSGK